MRSIKEIESDIATVKAELSKLCQERDKLTKKTLVRCQVHNDHIGAACGRALEIGTLVYIQTHWYVEPYGCTDGDYWKSGEGKFVCPFCGYLNRLYDRPDIEAKRSLFLVSVNQYDKMSKDDVQKFKSSMNDSRRLNGLPEAEIELPECKRY